MIAYAAIPFAALVTNIFTWSYVYAQKQKTPVNRGYLLFGGALLLWVLVDFLAWLPTPETWKVPLFRIACVFWLPSGFLFANFMIAFLQHPKNLVYWLFFAASIVGVSVSLGTDLVIQGSTLTYWGTKIVPGILFVPFAAAILVIPSSYAYVLAFKRASTTEDPNEKKQLIILLVGFSASLSLGVFSDILCPLVLNKPDFVRFASSGSVFISVFTYLAVTKYNFLSLGMEKVAEDLFENVSDGVVVANQARRIIQMNRSAKELFQVERFIPESLEVSDLFGGYDFGGKDLNREIPIHANETDRIVSISQSTLRQSGFDLGKLIILRDVTERKRAEEELRASEERFRGIFEGSPDPIALVGIGDACLYEINEAFCQSTGFAREEILGRTIEDLDICASSPDALRLAKPLTNHTKTDGLEAQFQMRNGRVVDMLVSTRPIRHDGRECVLAVCKDITERKRSEEELQRYRGQLERLVEKRTNELAESEERYRTVIESSNDGIAVIRGDRHTYVNQRFAEIFGYSRSDELVNQPLSTIFRADDLYRVMDANIRIQRKERVASTYEFQGTRKDGTPVFVEVSTASIASRGEQLAILFLRDITQRKHSERERETLIGDLKAALAQVNTLSGLLPICANCKRIRDDKGYWQQVEVYIQKHSQAAFSHSICPECTAKLYPHLRIRS